MPPGSLYSQRCLPPGADTVSPRRTGTLPWRASSRCLFTAPAVDGGDVGACLRTAEAAELAATGAAIFKQAGACESSSSTPSTGSRPARHSGAVRAAFRSASAGRGHYASRVSSAEYRNAGHWHQPSTWGGGRPKIGSGREGSGER